MKLLLVSSAALRTPPDDYGGLERVVYEHASGLAKLGHDVTLVGAKGSRAPEGVDLIETVEPWNKLNPAQQQAYGKADRVWNGWRAHEEEAYGFYKDRLGEFDLVSDHTWAKWAMMSKKETVIGTCHSVKSYNARPPREFALFTGVSRGHSRFLSAQLHTPVRTFWNPVDIDAIPLQKDKSDRFLSLNRVMPTKGIHFFIDVLEKAHAKGDIAGDDSQLVPDQVYVQNIRQRCARSACANYIGLVSDADRVKLLQNAKALLCFVDGGYQEVFGLQAVEALAAGTPVIAAESWGFMDTIVNGENGFLCKTPDEVVKRMGEIMDGTVKFDPEKCRASVAKFSKQESAKRAEGLFRSVVSGCRW
ncbi:MAG TPA: glycosyltransferase [Nitrososphaerales archaeon]|nr:glycosyltransferase [Nitrososphaerales archaeon]